jgi:hypothetical protein
MTPDRRSDSVNRYKVTFNVAESMLSSVMSALLGDEVKLDSVTLLAEAAPATLGPPLQRREPTQSVRQGTGPALILSLLQSEQRPFKLIEIQNAYLRDGRAKVSCYGDVRKLVLGRQVRDLGDHRFATMSPVVVRMGAAHGEAPNGR